MRAALTLSALALLALAGCFQATPRTDYAKVQGELEAAAAPVLAAAHDHPAGHFRAELHQGAHNLERVGYSNGVDGSGDPDRIPPTASWSAVAVTPTHAYLAARSSDGAYGGFSILDTANKSRPQVVGRFAAQGVAAIEVSHDGTLAFLASADGAPDQAVRGAAGQGGVAPPRGISVVDLSDRRAPVLDSFVPLPPGGPHALAYLHHPMDGNDYLLVCTYDLQRDPATGAATGVVPATQRMVAYLVQPSPARTALPQVQAIPRVSLVPVAQFQLLDPGAPGLAFPSGVSAAQDPLDPAKVYVTLAYWDKGVRILDFSHPPRPDPARPDPAQSPMLREAGAFTEFSPSAFNSIHLARRALVAGTPVTVAAPELATAPAETGQLTFLDTSDVARPAKASWWTLPAQDPPLGVHGHDFSPGGFDVWDGKVALAHHHAGVWVVDVHDQENLKAPKPVAFYLPSLPRSHSPVPQPDVASVAQQGGHLYVVDAATGLHILRYTGP